MTIGSVEFARLENDAIPEVTHGPGMDLEEWEADLDGLAGTATRGTVRFLIDGPEFFPRFIETIEGAEESVDIRTYIFDNDDYAVSVADLLRERSEAVDVRVLLDGIGALLGTQVDPEGMPTDFEPPISMPSYLERGSDVKVRTSGNPWLTGDHTKSTIIDGKVAFLGGMNIGREYRYTWHDLMVEVSGPIVDVLQRDLDIAWSKAGWFGDAAMLVSWMKSARQRADDVGDPVRVLVTRDHDSQIYRAKLAAIRRAQSFIYIENSYFSDDTILLELAKARRRGGHDARQGRDRRRLGHRRLRELRQVEPSDQRGAQHRDIEPRGRRRSHGTRVSSGLRNFRGDRTSHRSQLDTSLRRIRIRRNSLAEPRLHLNGRRNRRPDVEPREMMHVT